MDSVPAYCQLSSAKNNQAMGLSSEHSLNKNGAKQELDFSPLLNQIDSDSLSLTSRESGFFPEANRDSTISFSESTKSSNLGYEHVPKH